MDSDEGEGANLGEGLGDGEADEEGADEAGAVGDGDGFEVVPGGGGALHGLADDGEDRLEVAAGGDFWDDAAEVGVEVILGGDDVGKELDAAVGGTAGGGAADDGGGGFVTARFEAEEEHGGGIRGAGRCPLPREKGRAVRGRWGTGTVAALWGSARGICGLCEEVDLEVREVVESDK